MKEALWEKKIECPICKSSFKTFNVHREYIKLKSRDTDLRGVYEGINPNWYDVWVCPNCYYAAFRDDFFKLTFTKIKVFKEDIEERKKLAKGADFKKERNPYLALLSYQLGAYCYTKRRNSSEKVASLFTKAAWLARENHSFTLERDLLEKSVFYYKKSYEEETESTLDQIVVVYLIGEIERRLGNYEESIKYLSKAIYDQKSSKNAEIKRLAHDQYYLVKDILRKSRRPVDMEILNSLKRIEFFAPLTESDFTALVKNIGWKIYDKDEVIIRKDEEGDSFFIIKEGKVKVLDTKDGQEREIAVLGKSDFFGEMSLLTGKPRFATVIALEECELLIINKDNFANIILNNPSIAENMSRILTERRNRIEKKDKEEVEEKSAWNTFSLFLQIKNAFR
jgi:hypothetical protein